MNQNQDPKNRKVACAILSYNHPEITAKTTQSVLNFHPEADIFLVHNGSELKWVRQHQQNCPFIQHLVNPINRGFTGGVNFAFSHLFQIYEWVFLITNDCSLLTPLTPPQEPGIYSPLIYRRRIELVDSICGYFLPMTGKLQHVRAEKDWQLLFQKKSARTYVPGTAFWLHHQVFKAVGPFDESLHTYWEDVDYSQKVKNLGYKLAHDSKAKLIHAVGKTCHKNKFYTQHLFQRNRRIVSLKYCANPIEKLVFRLTLLVEKSKRRLANFKRKLDDFKWPAN